MAIQLSDVQTQEQKAPVGKVKPDTEAKVPEADEQPDGESEQQQDDAPDTAAVEAKARDMGWVPRERFKGNPDAWRPAAEWMEHGDKLLGTQLRQERETNQRKQSEFDDRIARMERMNEVALARQREQLTASFEAQKRAAVTAGDTDAFDRADKDQRAALKVLDDDAKAPVDKGGGLRLSPRDQEAVGEFQSENQWFKSDRRLTAAMDDHYDEVSREMPGASMADRLAEAKFRVETEFPLKFGRRPKGNGHDMTQRVESGSRSGGGGSAQRLASKLPAEARGIAERQVKEGLFKSLEDYAKIYFEENAA